jgi:uncharacterized protein YutE (UPF0331/DUF86 family)
MADDVVLNKTGVIERCLQRMVGFRTIAIHDYQQLNLDIVQSIVEYRLSDFTAFTERVLRTDGFRTSDS